MGARGPSAYVVGAPDRPPPMPDTTRSALLPAGPAVLTEARDVALVVNANASGMGSVADVLARATHRLRPPARGSTPA
jgi:hypothetical protein